jgi:hypothetical protein
METLHEHTKQIQEVKEQIVEINIRLRHVEDNLRRKIDYEEFKKLEKRVALLETR